MGAEVNDLVLNIVINAEVASRKLKNFNKTLDDTNRKLDKTTKASTMLSRAFRRFIVGFIGIQGIRSFVQTTRELDLMERSIVGLTKSTQDWNYIQNEALRTGTRLKDTARGYRNFYASASMAGFGKGQIQGMYSDLLTSTRAIGATPQQTQGALLALEQMISKGVVSMEELRRQLGNALPGAFEIGAKAMNMTTAEFNKLVKTGTLVSTVFVPKFIKALKEEFGGGFVEATKSMDFALNNLETRWQMLQRTLFKGQLGEGMTAFVRALTKFISNPMLVSSLKAIAFILGSLLKIISGILSQATLLMILISPLAIMGIVRGVKALALAMGGLNFAMSPLYATILAVIAGLIVIQDLIYGLFLRGKGFKSITGDIISGNDAPLRQEETQSSPLAKFFMNRRTKEQARNIKKFNERQPQLYSSPRGISGMFEKNENKTINISFGDINVKGGNSLQETAMAVREELVALFAGEKLRNGVMEWQPIA